MKPRFHAVTAALIIGILSVVPGCNIPIGPFFFMVDLLPVTISPDDFNAGQPNEPVYTDPIPLSGLPSESELVDMVQSEGGDLARLGDVQIGEVTVEATPNNPNDEDLAFIQTISVLLYHADETPDPETNPVEPIAVGEIVNGKLELTVDEDFDAFGFIVHNDTTDGNPVIVICLTGSPPTDPVTLDGELDLLFDAIINPFP